jgi:hypothetical protein
MKIKADKLKIVSGARDVGGHKIDPEAQPLARELSVDMPANLGGKHVGSLPSTVVFETTAGEYANAMRSPCFNCKHWDDAGARELIRRWDASNAPLEKRSFVNQMRGNIIGTKDPEFIRKHMVTPQGELNVNHALMSQGICRALTEIQGDVVFTSPDCHCPDDLCGPGRPSGLHEPKSAQIERHVTQAYDAIMKRAAGLTA